MKFKTEGLIDLALDWAVAEGLRPIMRHDHMRAKAAANNYKGDLAWHLEVTPNEPITVDETGVTHVLRPYSAQWSQGGPIIDRALISVVYDDDEGQWEACQRVQLQSMFGFSGDNYSVGPTSLIAAMRCHVTSELGDEVEIPDELMKQT